MNSSQPRAMMCDEDFKKQFRAAVLNDAVEEPLLLKGIHNDWKPLSLTLDKWGDLLRDKKCLKVRVGSKIWNKREPQWESECDNRNISWDELVSWDCKEEDKRSLLWAYYDYKYMNDILQTDDLNLFSWEKVGFPDRTSSHSTLWIGTEGAYTPCHFDTYSCNLVCQVYGRKTWLLFPPEDTRHLRPTRIPYEESSVYSSINFTSAKEIQKNLRKGLSKATPLKVTLQPGDCLYLPSKWWHYVVADTFSISVNTWVELQSDCYERVAEATFRSLFTSARKFFKLENTTSALNPNEVELIQERSSVCREMLEHSLAEFLGSSSCYPTEPPSKKLKSDLHNASSAAESSNQKQPKDMVDLRSVYSCSFVMTLDRYYFNDSTPMNFDRNDVIDINSQDLSEESQCDKDDKMFKALMNAVGEPGILSQITDKFIKNLTGD